MVALSLLVVRVGAIALAMTGLSAEVARFQALSAFSGAGFTTSESEGVVATPARRGVLLYGKADRLEELSERRAGDEAAHEDAKAEAP